MGRSLFGLVVTGLNTIFVLVLAHFLFGFSPGGPLGAALLVLVPTVVALYGFGFAYAALVLFAREANFLTDVGSFLSQVLSGIDFPVTALPRALMILGRGGAALVTMNEAALLSAPLLLRQALQRLDHGDGLSIGQARQMALDEPRPLGLHLS